MIAAVPHEIPDSPARARHRARKIAGAAEAVRAAFATPLERIAQLLRQRREDRGREKICALHAPEVECIGATPLAFR